MLGTLQDLLAGVVVLPVVFLSFLAGEFLVGTLLLGLSVFLVYGSIRELSNASDPAPAGGPGYDDATGDPTDDPTDHTYCPSCGEPVDPATGRCEDCAVVGSWRK